VADNENFPAPIQDLAEESQLSPDQAEELTDPPVAENVDEQAAGAEASETSSTATSRSRG
jgi:hypothetical protein